MDYIVEQTVGKLLEGKSPLDSLKLRVLDPACGSGSFLIRAYERLCEHWQAALTRDEKLRRKTDCWTDPDTGDLHLTTDLKRRILTANIFGVDLDAGAVEVTQLSLYLKMLEGESRATLAKNRELFGPDTPLLPPLENNIKCGNSLIASDFSLNPDDLVRVRAFDWDEGFREIMKGGGFDAVIGNPPYIDSEWMSRYHPDERRYCAEKYTAASGNWDIFCVFIDRAVQLAKQNGLVSQIVPNKLGSAGYAAGARKTVSEMSSLISIRDYSHVRVFPVSVYPLVFVSQKTKSLPKAVNYERMREAEEQTPVIEFDASLDYHEYFSDTNRPWQIFASISKSNLASRLSKIFPRLDNCATVLGAATVSEAYEIAKLVTNGVQGLKLVNSGTIDRYHAMWGCKECRYLGNSYINPVISHAAQIRLPKKRLEQSKKSKIIIAGMTLRLECTLDLNGEFLAGKSTSIVFGSSDLRYILAILNSQVVNYFYSSVFGGNKLQGGYLRIGPPQLSQIPIPPIDLKNSAFLALHDKLVALVDKMLLLVPKLRAAKSEGDRATLQNAVSATDRAIDALVYELYGLTADEIALVESSTKA